LLLHDTREEEYCPEHGTVVCCSKDGKEKKTYDVLTRWLGDRRVCPNPSTDYRNLNYSFRCHSTVTMGTHREHRIEPIVRRE
jgi:hypothetical protein